MPDSGQPQLWAFAESVYARAGVQQSLLWLQDNRQLDIPFFLFVLWTDICHISMSNQELRDSLSYATDFSRNAIQPIRASRRWLKTCHTAETALYKQCLETELAGEKALLENLERRLSPVPDHQAPGTIPALTNTLGYLGLCDIDDANAQARLAVVFQPFKQLPAAT